MSFLQSSQWSFATSHQNPESYSEDLPYRKASYDVSNLSTRKDSTDSVDLKFRYKTEVCKYWLNGEQCPFESFCSFAHGVVEKRYREDLPSKYKTKMCKNWINHSFCTYGTRCQFVHPQRLEHQEKDAFKRQLLLNFVRENQQLSFLDSKRLPVFNEITNSSAMQQLLGENYETFNHCLSEQKPFWNGKPRFYSI